ncbi:VOC family protein [Christensenella tenuis]|uniref:VOC family protein n=1 Tax=Christensenella tenuis TaxID=2763033 RepID=A0ABR7EBZ3_9FIRM|nr:VOC family protein [Christensenella tenuis]MBC5647290.1 VOC family protein [Christensenella tenuis]
MKIKGMDHIGINVSDMEKALHFYRDLLKLPVLQEKIDNGNNDVYYLQLGENSRVELFDYHGASAKKETADSDLGYRHLAMGVDDVDEWAVYLKENNVPIRYGPESLPHLGVRVCLIEDPDGTEIEICAEL